MLTDFDPNEATGFLAETIRRVRAELGDDKAIIGFCGAPFTTASYMIEGGSSRNFENTKEATDENFKPIFQLIAPPEYKAEVVTLDKAGGIACLLKATKIIEEQIKARGGTYKLVSAPAKIGNRRDDEDLAEKYNMNQDEDNSEGSQDNKSDMGDVDLDDGIEMEDPGEESKQ